MDRYRVIYIGNMYEVAEFIYFSEHYILDRIIVEKGRLTDEMLTFAYLRDIQLTEVEKAIEIERYISDIDFSIMCSFGKILPKQLINKTKIYNIHFGILPEYKGRHPNFYAFKNNEKFLGVTLHVVNEKIDDGEIISIFRIKNKLKYNEIDMFKMQTEYVERALDDLYMFQQNSRYISISKEGNYYSPVTADISSIDLQNDSLADIINKIKAQARYGGCNLNIDGKRVVAKDATLTTVCKFDKFVKIDENIYQDGNLLYIVKDGYTLKLKTQENI